MRLRSKIKSFNHLILQKRVRFVGMTVLEMAIILTVISGGATALFITRQQPSPAAPQASETSSDVIAKEPSQPNPVQNNASSSAPTPETASQPSNAQAPRKVDCSAEYYKNTKVYQEWWSYHQKTVKGYIDDINKQEHLTPDEKKVQINRWVSYFNDRVNELVATWKKSMSDSGCGSTPMGFSPGYMPLE